VGRLRLDGTVPADWLVSPAHGIAAAGDVSTTSAEISTVACTDGLGGFIVAWRVLDGEPPVLAGEVRAMRYTLQGAAVGVPPDARPGRRLRACWISDAGVRAAFGAGTEARRLDVCDLAGRRVAMVEVPATVTEVTVPGTRQLAPGLYFVRVSGPGGAERAKVVVTR